MTYIINADDLKKTLLGYDPARSELFHRESAKLTDTSYAERGMYVGLASAPTQEQQGHNDDALMA